MEIVLTIVDKNQIYTKWNNIFYEDIPMDKV